MTNPEKPEKAEKPEIKLPKCPHCGAIPIACRQPQNCKFEDLKK